MVTALNERFHDQTATHRFAVGTYVLHRVHLRSRKEIFRVTRLLPETGVGFQYRIKGEAEGFERVVTESSLEAAGNSFDGDTAPSCGPQVPERLAALLDSGFGPTAARPAKPRRNTAARGRQRVIPSASIAGSTEEYRWR